MLRTRSAIPPSIAGVARELTKKFEEFRHGTVSELLAHYEARFYQRRNRAGHFIKVGAFASSLPGKKQQNQTTAYQEHDDTNFLCFWDPAETASEPSYSSCAASHNPHRCIFLWLEDCLSACQSRGSV
jgi:hypothetical protein